MLRLQYSRKSQSLPLVSCSEVCKRLYRWLQHHSMWVQLIRTSCFVALAEPAVTISTFRRHFLLRSTDPNSHSIFQLHPRARDLPLASPSSWCPCAPSRREAPARDRDVKTVLRGPSIRTKHGLAYPEHLRPFNPNREACFRASRTVRGFHLFAVLHHVTDPNSSAHAQDGRCRGYAPGGGDGYLCDRWFCNEFALVRGTPYRD
jgi:hypothetical protein